MDRQFILQMQNILLLFTTFFMDVFSYLFKCFCLKSIIIQVVLCVWGLHRCVYVCLCVHRGDGWFLVFSPAGHRGVQLRHPAGRPHRPPVCGRAAGCFHGGGGALDWTFPPEHCHGGHPEWGGTELEIRGGEEKKETSVLNHKHQIQQPRKLGAAPPLTPPPIQRLLLVCHVANALLIRSVLVVVFSWFFKDSSSGTVCCLLTAFTPTISVSCSVQEGCWSCPAPLVDTSVPGTSTSVFLFYNKNLS